jgi:hypothetical protein
MYTFLGHYIAVIKVCRLVNIQQTIKVHTTAFSWK